MTVPKHPAGTYVGLYGSTGGQWRQRCKHLLDAASIPWHDPSDPRWDSITHENGDDHQELIDRLVAEEYEALRGAQCVIFHLAGGADPPASLAARSELGWLAGSGIETFVHVDGNARGRNYVGAVVKLYPHLVSCSTLEDAIQASGKVMGNAKR